MLSDSAAVKACPLRSIAHPGMTANSRVSGGGAVRALSSRCCSDDELNNSGS